MIRRASDVYVVADVYLPSTEMILRTIWRRKTRRIHAPIGPDCKYTIRCAFDSFAHPNDWAWAAMLERAHVAGLFADERSLLDNIAVAQVACGLTFANPMIDMSARREGRCSRSLRENDFIRKRDCW
jgi:hypothetical protein